MRNQGRRAFILSALRRGGAPAAGRELGAPRGGSPSDLDAVIGVVSHLEGLPPFQDLGEGKPLFPPVGPCVRNEQVVCQLVREPFEVPSNVVEGPALRQPVKVRHADRPVREFEDRVHGDEEAQVAVGRRKILPEPAGLEKSAGTARHRDHGAGMGPHIFLAVGHGFDPDDELFVEGLVQVAEGVLGVQGLGIDEPLHRIVERAARHSLLDQRKVPVFRARGDLRVPEEPQAAPVPDDRPEGLESRLPDDLGCREQEVSPPEALDAHRPVGLGVDGEQGPGAVAFLGDPAHEDRVCP